MTSETVTCGQTFGSESAEYPKASWNRFDTGIRMMRSGKLKIIIQMSLVWF